ncbi:MAG: L-serine ammonia-lyase [Legionellales bacterium]|nr:L-serine ammonia-lyase [Legionellales bacterium]
MHISLFDLFSIGIGPSSSHTVGPMRAAQAFIHKLTPSQLQSLTRVTVELYGSLALTGIGHGTDKAILMGLAGELPEKIDPDTVNQRVLEIQSQHTLLVFAQKKIHFNYESDLLFRKSEVLAKHTNGMRFCAYAETEILAEEIYYSIGGGFIVTEAEFGQQRNQLTEPYPFDTAQELLHHCHSQQKSIAEIMLANEKIARSEKDIYQGILRIANIMHECIEKGCKTHGILPGGLKVTRRAPILWEKMQKQTDPQHSISVLNWINLFAMAVNEENAAGSRVVTAPTNGAAGIIPAVLEYYRRFCDGANEQGIVEFLLTAGAIAVLYKKGASISGAEVGCQGEVGVASSMAAGALAHVLGGSVDHVEKAAEIAMEHHLGMTCDPIGGLVQIPCIERNAMGAVKAVNAARLCLMEDAKHKVPLDNVIATMKQTGRDMMTIYKETSQGGLAVNVPDC